MNEEWFAAIALPVSVAEDAPANVTIFVSPRLIPDHDDAVTRAEFDRLRALYPYVHRKVTTSPSRRIARLVPPAVVPPSVRAGMAGMLRRAPHIG